LILIYFQNKIGKKADEKHTHKWNCFVRSPTGEDLTTFIEKVVFALHPSFTDHERSFKNYISFIYVNLLFLVVTTHPFEIYESGWGEFEIVISIYFKDPALEAIDIYHNLKVIINRLLHFHKN
jgi:YEATS domain-containing protein 4